MANGTTNTRKIRIVFDRVQSEDVRGLAEWLEREGVAKVLDSGTEGIITLVSLIQIVSDSEIVFVSDEAVSNPEWQRNVRDIEDNVRLIPIGATENVDYSNPEVMPPRIESINFIRQDDFMFKNVLDALTIDSEFWAVKNSLNSQAEQWSLSQKSDVFLLHNEKEISQCLDLIREKLKTETDPYFTSQLEQIVQFLNISRNYAQQLRRKRLFENIRRIIAMVVVAVMFIAIFKLIPNIKRVYWGSFVLGATDVSPFPEVTSIKMLGILTNPVIDSEEVKGKALSTLLSCLSKPWELAPIGFGYAFANNDFTITSKTDHIWTAAGDGAVTKWNRNNGQIESHDVISDQSLDFISINQEETIFAAMDRNRTLFIKNTSVSYEWRRSDIHLDYQPKGIVVAEKDSALAVIGDTDITIISAGETIKVLENHHFAQVFNVIASADSGFYAVVSNGSQDQFVNIKAGGTVDSVVIPGLISNAAVKTSKVAISRGREVAFIDEQEQLVVWEYDEPQQLKRTGIVCSNLTDIQFVNGSTVVFSDRNQGTHLLDIINMTDLGQIITNAASISSLATSNNQVVGETSAGIHSQDITDFLPVKSIERLDILGAFDGAESTCESGIVRSLEIKNNYLILAKVLINGSERTYVIDGSSQLASGSDQVKNSLLQNIDQGNLKWPGGTIEFTGKPTVVGILPDGRTILVGAEDGSFHELQFSSDGSKVLALNRKQIASRSPIRKIFYLHDSYYILDSENMIWKFSAFAPYQTIDDYIALFKEKNHMSFDEDLLKTVSPELINRLNIQLTPVNKGKTWEYKS